MTSSVTVYQDATLLVAQLIIGRCRETSPGLFEATGSATLVSKNGAQILVDCGHPHQKTELLE
uniref:MBL fold metallo-hydrolase n=1 Tax=Romanomermis culicivorax TaxID=13658 RepID=A0A915J327_ROMCU